MPPHCAAATAATTVVAVTATAAKDVGWMLPIANHKQFTVVKFELFGYLQLNLMLCWRLQWICYEFHMKCWNKKVKTICIYITFPKK